MSEANLEKFRQLVLQDLSLQEQLRETPDLETFLARMVRLGEEHGYGFTTEDVQTALQASRRVWIERWME